MDVQDFEALGARPRRHVRPPLHYGNYEIDYNGLGARRHGQEREWMTRQEGAAKKTPLTFLYDSRN